MCLCEWLLSAREMPGLVAASPAPSESQKQPLKPCCACPETKKARDAWSVRNRGWAAGSPSRRLPLPPRSAALGLCGPGVAVRRNSGLWGPVDLAVGCGPRPELSPGHRRRDRRAVRLTPARFAPSCLPSKGFWSSCTSQALP